ncbi:MAG: rhodanese-like domain-containing protein [Chloroflexi bacterium]|nr:rhodanese-like domain-containing protein [Chloroflexota bacterium]
MGYQKFQEGAFLLDVRTQGEWEEYHVDGATMIVLDELESRVSEVPFDKEVIIICNSGNRSQVARDILLNAGHTSVTSIAGGIQGWMKAGHEVVTGK